MYVDSFLEDDVITDDIMTAVQRHGAEHIHPNKSTSSPEKNKKAGIHCLTHAVQITQFREGIYIYMTQRARYACTCAYVLYLA